MLKQGKHMFRDRRSSNSRCFGWIHNDDVYIIGRTCRILLYVMKLLLLILLLAVVAYCDEKSQKEKEDQRPKEDRKSEALDELIDEIFNEKDFNGTRSDARKLARERIQELNKLKKLRMKILKCQYPQLEDDEEPGDSDENTLQGDMRVDPTQVKSLIEAAKESLKACLNKGKGTRGTDHDKRNIRDFATMPGGKWGPIIEYDDHKLVGAMKEAVAWSFEQYHKHIPCLSFKRVASCSGRSNCMQFTLVPGSPGSCFGNSPVGKNSQGHNINLSECSQLEPAKSVAIHEIGHSFGLPHTQVAPDRDDYVSINWDNMEKEAKHNFVKEEVGTVKTYGVKYDFDSMMHYGQFTFSANNKPVIVTKDPSKQSIIGERVGFSEGDKILLNKAYCSGEEVQPVCLENGKQFPLGTNRIDSTGNWVKTCKVRDGQTGFYNNGCASGGKMYFNNQEYLVSGSGYYKCIVDENTGSLRTVPSSCSFGFQGQPMNHIKTGCIQKISNYLVWCVDTGNGVSRAYMGPMSDAQMNTKAQEVMGEDSSFKMC